MSNSSSHAAQDPACNIKVIAPGNFGNSPSAGPRDLVTVSQVKLISWNSRRKSIRRVRPIINAISAHSPRTIAVFQEVPKWRPAVLKKRRALYK